MNLFLNFMSALMMFFAILSSAARHFDVAAWLGILSVSCKISAKDYE